MPPLPIPIGGAEPPAAAPTDALVAAVARANRYMAADKAASTLKAYRARWGAFAAWCQGHGLAALPASDATLATYLAVLTDAGLSVSTLDQHAAAVAWRHRELDLPPPNGSERVKRVQRGIRRTVGAPPGGKAPITAEVIRRLLKALHKAAPESRAGRRDHALMLVGFAGAFRREELVAIEIADLAWSAEGVRVTVRRSKTDQEGRGHEVSIPNGRKLRPVAALRAWLDAAEIRTGPVFRGVNKGGAVGSRALSGQSVALVVKRWAEAAGLDPDLFGGHSLRSGMITQALIDEIDVLQIMELSRHSDPKTLRKYDRRVKGFAQHAGRKSL